MIPQHAITNFNPYTIGNLITAAGQTVNGLGSAAGIALYTTLPVSTALVQKQADDLQKVQDKPEYHGKGADSDAARLTLETSLHDNGVYVNIIAKGDLVKLAISGYPISQAHHPVGPLAKGVLHVSQADQSGAFTFEITGIHHEKGFIICYTEATNTETDPAKWSWHWTAKSTGTLSQLKGSVKYKLSAVGVGTDPTLTFSDMVTGTTKD